MFEVSKSFWIRSSAQSALLRYKTRYKVLFRFFFLFFFFYHTDNSQAEVIEIFLLLINYIYIVYTENDKYFYQQIFNMYFTLIE